MDGRDDKCTQNSGRKPERKRPLREPTLIWENNIKMDVKNEDVNWIQLAKDRNKWWALVTTVMNIQIP
jgi:hypothetical protein